MKLWIALNDALNYCGGLISTVSFIVSIVIFFKTGQIKKSIKNMLNYEKYSNQKQKTQDNLQGILESIREDDIFDEKLLGEIHREIAALEHYTIFFDRKTSKNMKSMQKILKKEYSKIRRDEIVVAINKVLGDLDINEVYIG